MNDVTDKRVLSSVMGTYGLNNQEIEICCMVFNRCDVNDLFHVGRVFYYLKRGYEIYGKVNKNIAVILRQLEKQ